ncbi:long-chain fatty acid--CoA ligase [Arthrobacter sp. zg-Y1171]|uniref:acyl-CoA synthetase n=1 Tax=Arthrobacter sp. zg-Y1171 TaxID=2964610 RepID=UPI0021065DB7|nr:long-chain fatty acid--CoA ligase [Arthrobacter sp. zg-Y1171]MCQ1994072.1 long-chain fatty acid--CoA ligase [Arthrobacter sp. zg-Y1171]UWX81821.1 long-chain fatty acid--CoA ligase [Arthrobacter sp. zg-Y1171]
MNLGIGSWPARRAKVRPHDPAIVFEGREWSYADVDRRVRQLANALLNAGIRRGDRVAYVGFNHPALLETFFAAGLIGAACVLVNPRLRQAEVDYILRDCGARAVVYTDEQRENIEQLAAELDVDRWLSVDGGGPGTGFEDFLSAGSEDPVPDGVEMEDLALIMYTSGTTGRPKGAMLSHQNLFYQYVNALIGVDLRQDEVHLAVAPLFHIAGLNMMTLPAFTLGGRIIIHRSFKPDAVLREIAASRVTSSFMVPAMLDALSEHPGFADADLSSVRGFMVGGSPVPERMIRTWAGKGAAIMQGFGMTETGPGVCMLEARDGVTKAGSAGRSHFFTEHQVVDFDGKPVPPGAPGEVIVRGPNVMSGYWNKPEETAKALADGWYHSGDIAVVDEDGYMYIKDRIKDMYISGGENVYPAEVENALLNIPGVRDAAVIGIPDSKWGETGLAFIVLADGDSRTSEDLRAQLGQRLATYKLPRRINVVTELPRTATGKIQKHVLRAGA